MKDIYDLIIIGGGAAGMMTAITAGRRGRSVLVVEGQDVPGKKLSATGNGRCNITHDPISHGAYHTDHKKRLQSVLSQFSFEDTRRFFEGIGVSVYNRDGYVYPRSNEALSVVKCLSLAMEEAGVDVLLGCRVVSAKKTDGSFVLSAESKDGLTELFGNKLVIACGGMAGTEVGGCDFGIELAKSFNHRISEPFPALTDLVCEGLSFKKIKGVRTQGKVEIIMDDEVISSSVGELQFTGKGISGIPIFNVSFEAISALKIKKDIYARIDLFPELTMDMLFAYLTYRFSIGRRSAEEAFLGFLPEKLIPELLKLLELNGKKAGRIEETKRRELCQILKGLPLRVTGHGDYSHSQVMAGGVLLHDLKDTLESDSVEGLYFAGEIINADGICGGYNLQWAWSCGAVVGNAV